MKNLYQWIVPIRMIVCNQI